MEGGGEGGDYGGREEDDGGFLRGRLRVRLGGYEGEKVLEG